MQTIYQVNVLYRLMLSTTLTSRFSLKLFTVLTVLTWYFVLLIHSGDIHKKPGPTDSSYGSSEDSSYSIDLSNHLSLVHYNVQSLFNKLDIIQVELPNFDIIALSETLLKPPMDTSDITLSHYHSPERKDRIRDGYGGVIVFIKDSFSYKRRLDLEVLDVECIWIELTLPKNKRI